MENFRNMILPLSTSIIPTPKIILAFSKNKDPWEYDQLLIIYYSQLLIINAGAKIFIAIRLQNFWVTYLTSVGLPIWTDSNQIIWLCLWKRIILGPDRFWVCFELLILIQKYDLNVPRWFRILWGQIQAL